MKHTLIILAFLMTLSNQANATYALSKDDILTLWGEGKQGQLYAQYYLEGVIDAYVTGDAINTMRDQKRMLCVPGKLTANTELLISAIKTSPVDGEKPAAIAVLTGLQKMFPCE